MTSELTSDLTSTRTPMPFRRQQHPRQRVRGAAGRYPRESGGGAELELVDRWWRAANYLSVGQIYLRSNPLLREPLGAGHTKSRLLGHWGTTPGLNFVYAHLNRVIRRDSQNMLFIAGPGHGGPAVVANAWLEGTYSEIYSNVGDDEQGMAELFRQFSYPGGIPSHAAPETPGSISEGGELGYSLAHAYGSVFDNPDLVTAVVIGDGEAETGPLAASWHSHNFLDPVHDGAVLPDPAPERLQDRQPHHPGPHARGPAGTAAARLRARAALRDRGPPGRHRGRAPGLRRRPG